MVQLRRESYLSSVLRHFVRLCSTTVVSHFAFSFRTVSEDRWQNSSNILQFCKLCMCINTYVYLKIGPGSREWRKRVFIKIHRRLCQNGQMCQFALFCLYQLIYHQV